MFPKAFRIFNNAAANRVIPTSTEVKTLLAFEVPDADANGNLAKPTTSQLPLTDSQLEFVRSLLPLSIEQAAEKARNSPHYESVLEIFLNPPVAETTTARDFVDDLRRPSGVLGLLNSIYHHEVSAVPGLAAGFNPNGGDINWPAVWDFTKTLDPQGKEYDLIWDLAGVQSAYNLGKEQLKKTSYGAAEQLGLPFDLPKYCNLQWERWRTFSVEMLEAMDELARYSNSLDEFMQKLPALTVSDVMQAYPEWGEEILPILEKRQWSFDEEHAVYYDDEAAAVEDSSRRQTLDSWMKNWDAANAKFHEDFFSGLDAKPPAISFWHLSELTAPEAQPHRVSIIEQQFYEESAHHHDEHHH